ncbi:DUF6479 family protein [Streptomyces sp. NPDC058171]
MTTSHGLVLADGGALAVGALLLVGVAVTALLVLIVQGGIRKRRRQPPPPRPSEQPRHPDEGRPGPARADDGS